MNCLYFFGSYALGALGRRRGWMALTQLALFVVIGALGMLDPQQQLPLIAGGVFPFRPVLRVWMLPLGLLLLAVALPVLRGPISVAIIRSRRTGKRWLRRWRNRRKTPLS